MSSRFKQNEIDKLMLEMPQVPKSFEKWMSESPFKNINYIFYKRKGKKKTGYCSRCKKLFTYESRKKHNDSGKCLSCKAQVTYKAINQAKTYEDSEVVSIIQKMNGGFIVRYFKVKRIFKQNQDTSNFPDLIPESLSDPLLSFYEGSRVYICFFKNGKSRYINLESQWHWKINDFRWINEINRSGFNNKLLLRDSEPFIYKKNLKGVLKDSKWKYCGLDQLKSKYMNIDDYLYAYEKYPSIEMLSKLNMSSLLSDVIRMPTWSDGFYGEYIKMGEKRLGLSKTVFKKAITMNLNLSGLKKLAYYNKANIKLSDELFSKIQDYRIDFTKKIFKYASVVRAVNYVEKHSEHDKHLILGTWKDYINQCEYLGLNLEQSAVLYPRNLFDKHDEYTKIIQAMKNEKIIKRFSTKTKYWSNKLNYSKGKFSVKVAESIDAMKFEGESHGHCVGSYGARVASKNMIILFIRKKDDKPYFTVELNLLTLEVVQIQGKSRRSPTKQINSFIKEWQSIIRHNRMDIKMMSA